MNTGLTGTDPHQDIMILIPWYVNGTLAAPEAARVSAHLEGCTDCRRDYDTQLRLCGAMQSDGTLVFAAEPSFQKLMARINTGEDAGDLAGSEAAFGLPRPQPAVISPPRRASRAAVRWLAAAVMVQGLCLGYGAWAWHASRAIPASAYVTLTSPEPSYRDSPRVRIVFRSGLSMQGLGVLLHDAGAHIIDGPTDSNVYTLGFAHSEGSPDVLDRRVTALRASTDVMFAEPLGSDGDSETENSR